MEYFEKILCISKEDLTYDDRPVRLIGSVVRFENERTIQGKPASQLPAELLAPIMSESCYKMLAYRGRIQVVSAGVGRGNKALVAVDSLPDKYRDKVEAKYGKLGAEHLRMWFASHWEMDTKAQTFFAMYRFDNGKHLTMEQQDEYTRNASTIQAVIRLMDDTNMKRAVMQGSRICWGEMAGAVDFYREEFGHTLPRTLNHFKRRVNEFRAKGYESLISKKFGNQNTRKVYDETQTLIDSLSARDNKPWNKEVWRKYTQFKKGEIELFDPETGEIFNPDNYPDLSESTIQAYLTQPKNQLLVDNSQMTWTTWMHAQRPHVHRHAPEYSFSKISFDDRDLPRKEKDSKIRPKAYYAYDVASQCVVGYAYNRYKNVDLVVDMFRNMFRFINNNGLGFPEEVEVENHLMSQWKDSFLKAGEVFRFVHFCAPQNSQEKFAEPMNRSKKVEFEHEFQNCVGRFYAKSKKYRTEAKKVFDEFNDTYEDNQYYSWEQLIADDMAIIAEFNNAPHPNQKKYPGMSRLDVLFSQVNPNLKPYEESLVVRFIGEHVATSIRRNSYCRVNYTDYWLSSPYIMERLAPNNYNVDAYYIPEDDGTIKNVYIYQNGVFIDQLVDKGTFNTAAAEQTESDRRIMGRQMAYVKEFDKMMKEDAVKPVGVMRKEAAKQITDVAPKAVPMAHEDTDLDNLIAQFSDYAGRGAKSV